MKEKMFITRISSPKVLESAAGFYIGRVLLHEDGHQEPYDRISGYFRTQEQAQSEIDSDPEEYMRH